MKKFKILLTILVAVLLQACSDFEIYNENNNDNTVPDDEQIELVGAVDLGLSVEWAACDLGSILPYVRGREYSGYELFNNNLDYISGTTYDPATEELGEGWRMPTRQEAEELLADCNIISVTFHNTDGWLITGPSGKTIFMTQNTKWTGTKEIKNTTRAYVFGPDKTNETILSVGLSSSSTYPNSIIYLSIRPVKEKKQ